MNTVKRRLDGKNPIVALNVDKLRRIAAEVGLSESELAAIAGIDHRQITRVVQKGQCAASTVEKLANALHVMDTDLMFLEAVA